MLDDLPLFLRKVEVTSPAGRFHDADRARHYCKPERGKTASVWRSTRVVEGLFALLFFGQTCVEIVRDRNANEVTHPPHGSEPPLTDATRN
jgi:hypothetical protein